MPDFEVRGSRELTALSDRLKAAGNRTLRNQLLRRIRISAKKAEPDVRQSARRVLPRRGGLSDRVARQPYSVRSSFAGSGARVSLIGQGMKELGDIDAGRLRHPVFGNRKRWKAQSVVPGFFSGAVERRAPRIRRDIEQVMGDVAHQITRGKL